MPGRLPAAGGPAPLRPAHPAFLVPSLCGSAWRPAQPTKTRTQSPGAWIILLTVGCAAPLFMGASYRPTDPKRDSQEMVLKLTSDLNKVDHSIEGTKELIKQSADATYLADLYFRLAELYVERSRYAYARIMENKPEGESALGGDQALEVQISKRLAIETYSKVIKEFSEYYKVDQIRFFKAHEYRELGEFETMIKEYKELIDKHPKSVWAMEARLILGDHHFDKGEIDKAQKFYMEILGFPESHLHDMARYKMGWIRINQEKFTDALMRFEAAVRSRPKKRRGAIGDAKSLNIKRESLLAMVWPFSEVRKPFQAPDYFRRLAGSKTLYTAVMKKLANRYFVKTEYPSAALLYREIVPLNANIEENVEFIQRIYDSIANMSKRNPRRYSHAARDVAAIVKVVARFQNHWRVSEEDKKNLKKDFEIRARDLAVKLHDIARRKGDKRSARVVAEAYRKYLSLFSNAKERHTIQKNRAIALFESKDYLRAAMQHEEIAKDLKPGPELKKRLYESIVSYHRALDDDVVYRRKHPTKPGLLNKLQLLKGREGLKQLGAYYVQTWPKGEHVTTVKFNIATMYYQQGDYEKAAELFAAFVREYPTDKEAATAGNLALDALNKLDDLEALSKLGQEFANNPAITDRAFKAQALSIAKAARQRKVEMTVIATSDGDFSETMLNEWEKHKGSAEGEDFLYTAFVKYKNEGNIAGVFDFGGRMIGAYPNSKRLVDVMGTMGAFAIRAADFDRAAVIFEEFNKRFAKEKNAPGMMLSAANIRFFLGDFERAARDYEHVIRGGSGEQKREAFEKLLELYRDTEDWGNLGKAAQAAMRNNPRSLGAAFHLGLAHSGMGNIDQARREFQRAAGLSASSDFDQASKGRLGYELGRLMHQEYDAIQFQGAGSAEQVLGSKIQYLEALEKTYLASIQSGQGKWGIASLFEIARAYRNFGEFLNNAPMPPGLSGGDAQQYRQALGQQAKQYEDKAKETLRACTKKTKELKVFSEHASACLAGNLTEVSVSSTRMRGRVSLDEGTQRALEDLRGRLVKKPGSTGILIEIARRAVQVGDYHLAKLTLSKAEESDPRSAAVQNLLGVVNWNFGKHQEAYQAFSKAKRSRLPQGAVNMAALLKQFGYDADAKRALRDAGDLAGVDFNSPDIHASARNVLQE